MPPNSFSEVFGGSNIYPSQPTYLSLNPLTADVALQWPIEQAISGALVVADIVDINPTGPGLTVMLPDARQGSEGFTALFNNIGANTVDILAADGSSIVSIVSGTVWQAYLIDNTTEAGTWRIFQFGASVSTAVASALSGAGLKAIGTTLNERMIVVARNSTPYNVVNADRANVQQWTGGVGSFVLPTPASVGSDWFTVAKNQGGGNLTLSTVSGNIDGNATLVLAPGQSVWIVTDGVNYFSLAGSSSGGAGGSFNLITIDVSGTGNFVLSGAQLNQIGYKFTGALTGNRQIIVPNTTQEYWVDNETTGAFTLQVQTAGQSSPAPPVITQGARNILYCDGTNVVAAETSTVSFPIAVVQGGTGSTTAAGARANLGSTAVGDAIFTSVSQAAAQATLNVPPNTRLVNTSGLLSGGGDLSADRTLTYAFKGCTISRSAFYSTTLNNTTAVTFDTNVTDQGGWHSTVTNPSRITVPAGVAFAEISFSFTWTTGAPVTTNQLYYMGAYIRKNGAAVIASVQNVLGGGVANTIDAASVYLTTGPIAVAPGDYFELLMNGQDTGNVTIVEAFGPGTGIAPTLSTGGYGIAKALG